MSSVIQDSSAKKFFLQEDGKEAHLMYREIGNAAWDLYHTFVPPEFRGRGIAGLLAEAAIQEAQKNGRKIVPSCSFVQTYLKRHPEYNDMVME